MLRSIPYRRQPLPAVPSNISSGSGFQLNNPGGGPAISTTGDVSLDADNSGTGFITQAAGASGAIIAGTLSAFAAGGNSLDNPANAVSGNVRVASLGDVTFVNSLATHLAAALAGGKLKVVSNGRRSQNFRSAPTSSPP